MLAEIIENKRKEVEISKREFPLSGFKSRLKISTRYFKRAISKNKLSLIAEIKRASPSNKEFKNLDIRKIIIIYNKYADAISVLTDKQFFNGSFQNQRLISLMVV